jgi:hypothetical protein
MRDPWADQLADPYELLGLSDQCTPGEAERAMDAFLGRTRGRENEALDACDTLRDPARRLTIDIFRYPPSGEPSEPSPPAEAELDAIAGRIARKADALAARLKWDRMMPVMPVDEIPPPGGGQERD